MSASIGIRGLALANVRRRVEGGSICHFRPYVIDSERTEVGKSSSAVDRPPVATDVVALMLAAAG
jgi:hypothetical protein